MKNILLAIFGIVLLIISGVILAFQGNALLDVVKANSWIETKCLIKEASI